MFMASVFNESECIKTMKKKGGRTTSAHADQLTKKKRHFDKQNMTYDKSFINGFVPIQFTAST